MTGASSQLQPRGEQRPEVSVVIPLGRRYEDLKEICRSLRRVLAPVAQGYEVIFVDDANEPETQQQLRAVSAEFSEVRIIRLKRSMGESAAIALGAKAAQGTILVTLDPYLHVSLDEIPKLLAPLRHGTDLVCTWRFPRQEKGLNLLASEGFNAVARYLTKSSMHDLNSRTRAMRREVLEELPMYGDLHRFLPIFASRRGFTLCEIQVPQQPGKQEVGALDPASYIRRLLDLLTLAFLTRFMKRPLHFFGLIGLTSFVSGLLISLHLIYVKLIVGHAIGHRPLLLLAVLLIVVGIQVASIGLLGELMIFTHARELQDYVIEEQRG